MAKLFGRQRELEHIEQLLSSARGGTGSLVLLTGEPGIGKSSLGREVGASAASAGMRVLSGRCWEAGGAAPYWPWVQVFRSLGSAPFEDLVRADGGDSQQRRFQLFDAATRALASSAAGRPLLVFLDDLHAADLPSLLLLLFLSRQLSAWPLLVLAASREVEPRLAPEVGATLAKIGREGEVLSLARLTREEVAAWMAQSEVPSQSPEEVFRVTEGNPLFVHEVLRFGARSPRTRASDGIQVALDEHLRKLSAEARVLLEAAAVLGRDFAARELLDVTNGSHDAVLGLLGQALDLGVLEATEREHFQFTHVLLRDRLYESLSPARRSELHWQAGLVAEARQAEPARIANHLVLGAGAGDPVRAATSALAAAAHALRTLAFEAANELAAGGLGVLGPEPSRLACQLEIACGEGLIRSGSIDAGRARCVRAAEMAKALGCAEEQARAALAYSSELTGAPVVDPGMVRLLHEAREVLGTADSPLAARLGVRLATALVPPRTEPELDFIRSLARGSLAMARRLGDAETLIYVLEFARSGLAYAIPSDEIFEVTREVVTLARQLDQRLTLLQMGPYYAVSLLERGSSVEAEAALVTQRELQAALDVPQSRWRLPMLEAGFALFRGQLDDAERLGDEALAIAEHGSGTGAQVNWALQRIALAIARAEPARIAPHAARLLAIFETVAGPWAKAHRAWLLGAIGQRDAGRSALGEAAAVPLGFPQLIVAAEACVLLGDRQWAASFRELLRERSFGLPFLWGAACAYVFGPTSRLLGELAQLLGLEDEARAHYQESIAFCRRVAAKPFLELSRAALERLEAGGSGRGVEPDGSRSAADAADADARPSISVRRTQPREVFLQREGDVWAFRGTWAAPIRLKHSKGLTYLNELLSRPGQELHVLALVGLDHASGDAGPVLDARAKADYKRRLEALEDQLAEAEGFGDIRRANLAREEIEVLAAQLAGAVGLGGRDRRTASDAERARINVQRRLKDAIASIGESDAELGRYLTATVKTGIYCSFTPV